MTIQPADQILLDVIMREALLNGRRTPEPVTINYSDGIHKKIFGGAETDISRTHFTTIFSDLVF